MNLLKKIEALFSNEAPVVNPTEVQAENPTELKFKNAKLKDGTIIQVTDDLVVGAKVEIVNEDGTLSVPTSPTLEVANEDGSISVVTVDASGIITEITAQEAEPAEEEMKDEAEKPAVEEKAAETEAPKEGGDVTARVDALEAKVSELINAVNGLVDAINGGKSEMESVKKENETLKTENEELSKKASAPGASFKKFDKTVEIKIVGPQKDDMLSRVLRRKSQI